MKLLTKIAVVMATAGAAATMYAAPNTVSGNISVEQMLAQSQTAKAQMVADYQHVEHLQLLARREKDVIKLNCVNDKLVEMKPQMNVADRLISDLQNARDAGDQQQTFSGITVAADSVKQLREAADQCVGERLLVTESSNDYTHPDIPDDPGDSPFGPTIEPPAYASPVN